MRKNASCNNENRFDNTILQLNTQLRHIECVRLKGTCLKRSSMNGRVLDLLMPRDVYAEMLGTICNVRYDLAVGIRP